MDRLRDLWKTWSAWIHDRVPPGLRTLLGVILVIGGLLGFLPILGFWMIPLGIAAVLMDVKPLLGLRHRQRGSRPQNRDDERR